MIWSLSTANLAICHVPLNTDGLQTKTEIHRVIHDLRGGMNKTEAAWLLLTLWMLFGGTSSSFPKPGYPYPSSSTSLGLENPSSMPHQQFTSLTKEQRRNLPHPNDGFISIEGRPKLVVRYNQVKFKTPDHGELCGLPTNQKGKTPKTEANALVLRDFLVNMANSKKLRWYENGMYQGGTQRG